MRKYLFVVMVAVGSLAGVGLASERPLFVAKADTPEHAAEYADAALAAKQDICRFWLGHDAEFDWVGPCQIIANVGNMGAGGATSFPNEGPTAYRDYRMTVQGSHELIKATVIAHECDHVVRHTVLRKTEARWLDEGIASLFECESEHHRLREQSHGSTDCLSANFDAAKYPDDMQAVLRMYAQGFTFTEWLLQQKGREQLLAFTRDPRKPSEKIHDFYGVNKAEAISQWADWNSHRQDSCKQAGCKMHALHVHAAISTANYRTQESTDLVALHPKWFCYWCWLFQTHVANSTRLSSGIFDAGFNLRQVYAEDNPQLVSQLRAASQDGREHYPAFIVPSTGEIIVGYDGDGGAFITRLRATKASKDVSKKRLAGDPHPAHGQPPTLAEPEPINDPSPFQEKKTDEPIPVPAAPVEAPRPIIPPPIVAAGGVEPSEAESPVEGLVKKGAYFAINEILLRTIGFGLGGPVGLAAGAALSVGGFLVKRWWSKRKAKAAAAGDGPAPTVGTAIKAGSAVVGLEDSLHAQLRHQIDVLIEEKNSLHAKLVKATSDPKAGAFDLSLVQGQLDRANTRIKELEQQLLEMNASLDARAAQMVKTQLEHHIIQGPNLEARAWDQAVTDFLRKHPEKPYEEWVRQLKNMKEIFYTSLVEAMKGT